MPRRRLLRRFEPRFGVSQFMLESEGKWLERELDGYLLLSIADLRKTLTDRQARLTQLDANLSQLLSILPEREMLALKCMMARDCGHIGLLYQHHLVAVGSAATGQSFTPGRAPAGHHTESTLPFRESLFDP